MSQQRIIDVYSAGCPVCDAFIAQVNENACPSCTVNIRDMNDPEVAARAESLGIRSVPAVVIDGKLATCCDGGPDLRSLQLAGLGRPLA